MDIKERRIFYERCYFYELDRRENIYRKLGFPIAILTLTVPAHIILIKETIGKMEGFYDLPFTMMIFYILSVYILFLLLNSIRKGLTGWEYLEMPLLQEFEKYHSKLLEHYKLEVEAKARKAWEENLIERFIECADHNSKINEKRVAYVTKYFKMLPFYITVLILLYVIHEFAKSIVLIS